MKIYLRRNLFGSRDDSANEGANYGSGNELPTRLLTLENAQVLNAHTDRVTKAQTDIYCSKMLVRFYGLSLLTTNEVEVAFVEDVVSDMPDDERFRKFADYVVEN